MNVLEEIKKRREEEESEQRRASQAASDEKENETARIRQEILSAINNYDNLSHDDYSLSRVYDAIATDKDGVYNATKEQKEKIDALRNELMAVHRSNQDAYEQKTGTYEGRALGGRVFNDIDRELERAKADTYYPSMAMLIEKNRFTEEAWRTLITIGGLPENYIKWYDFLANDRDLAKQLIQAIRNAKKRIDDNKRKKWASEEKRRKIIVAAICIPASFIFFLLIFVFQSIGIVVGSIIAVAIMAEALAISGDSSGLGNRIGQMIGLPILGGIGGLIVGVVAWILSSFWTFVMILWAIVMIIAVLIAIFALSDT